MNNLSLADVLKIHRDHKRTHFNVVPKGGEFDVAMYTIPDAEAAQNDQSAWKRGQRVFREVKHNLVTRFLSEWAGENNQLNGVGGASLFISPDYDQPHVLKDIYRATYIGGNVTASSFDIDTVSRLWTITGTILAPAAGKVRTFRTVGVSNLGYQTYVNAQANRQVIAATRLSDPARTQDETQQVVISYRLAWEEARNV